MSQPVRKLSPENAPVMPTTMALEIVERMRDDHEMAVTSKLSMLTELSEDSISFKSPEEAMRMISMLGQLISSNLDPRLRAAALAVMERMIDLEQRAELQHGRPQIKWDVANMIWEKAKRQKDMNALVDEGLTIMDEVCEEKNGQEGADHEAAAEKKAAPKPYMGMFPPPKPALDPALDAELNPKPRPTPEPAQLKPERPMPVEAAAEPSITKVSLMHMLRSVAAPGQDDAMRELAGKLIAKIESQTAQIQPCPAPTCSES